MAAQLIADRRDVDFVLYEQLEVENLQQAEKFSVCQVTPNGAT